MTPKPMPKLQLHGFNNLTKTLSLNLYDVRYASTPEQQECYIAYIDEAYNAERLTRILGDVSRIIGATILNIARQDYEPKGTSVAMLISEEPIESGRSPNIESPGPLPETVLCHLDKSHITVHTYPESHSNGGIHTLRADIDVSTCGDISPLKALNYLLHDFAPDVVTIDYRVRGFTRDATGKKCFIDHPIDSIQNYLSKDTRARYRMIDVNIDWEHIFHTKMILKGFEPSDYLFGADRQDLPTHERAKIERCLRREMAEIFHGENPHRDLRIFPY